MFFQGYAFTAVLAGLMSTFLVVRHTRTDEELGRAELLGSVPLPRAASLAATLLLGAAANLLLAVFVAAGFVAAGLRFPAPRGPGPPSVLSVSSLWASPRPSPRSCPRAGARTVPPQAWSVPRICSGVSGTRWGPRRRTCCT